MAKRLLAVIQAQNKGLCKKGAERDNPKMTFKNNPIYNSIKKKIIKNKINHRNARLVY